MNFKLSDINAALLKQILASTIWVLTWAYLYLALLLSGWALLTSSVTGWDPTVVTTGSMSPTIRPGDVVLFDDPGDELLGQRSVILFEDPGSPGDTITHRIAAVSNNRYITQGDANPSPDIGTVGSEEVKGVARLVIPFVGLPSYWLNTGNMLAFLAWMVVTIGAIGFAIAGSRRKSGTAVRATSSEAHAAVRRVRVLAVAIIGAQFFMGTSGFDSETLPVTPLAAFSGCVLLIGSLNFASIRISRTEDAVAITRFALFELAADTMLAVVLTSMTGTSGVGWVLFALPIVEAAIRFRLAGALVQWVIMTTLVVLSRIWVLNLTGQDDTALFDELKGSLDQLSVLLLVAIPGAYLAEQLLRDVGKQRSATFEATERNRLFQLVVDIGQDVGRLGAEVFTTVSESVIRLGFDVADVCAREPNGSWQTIATARGTSGLVLPAAGGSGSGLRDADLRHRAVVVDRDDSDAGERAFIERAGLTAVVRLNTSSADDVEVVIRAGVAEGKVLEAAALSALQLLVNQTSVALQNDVLLEELRSTQQQLEHKATHDELTGLPNRGFFHTKLGKASARPHGRVGLLFCDLNGFKPVNDRLGHDVGDDLLVAVARRFTSHIGEAGVVARLGGDEFTVLLPVCPTEESAIEAAERLAEVIRQPFMLPGGHVVSISTSIGIATTSEPIGPDDFLRNADTAMYHAKSAGGSDWAVYTPALDIDGDLQRQLSTDLATAIDLGQVEMHYQPIVDARSRRMVGAEALLRWHHPEQGWISPPETIALAERSGMSQALTQFVVTSAAERLRTWGNLFPQEKLFVSINLSPGELESPELLAIIEDAMADSSRHNSMWIEISEKLVADGAGRYLDNLQGLDRMGFQLVLDDFGEGHTALGYMRDLPISGLKMDRNLVVNSVASPADGIIFDSVVDLAHRLGLFVVAEGVEDQQQVDRSRNAGCDLLQGYQISMAVPSSEIDEVMATHAVSVPPISSVVKGAD